MNKFKELIGLIVYKCAPIKKNRIVFTSFEGQYNDNPKALALKFHELYGDKFELIWLLKDLNNKECPDFFKKIKIGTIKSFWIRGSAKIQIDNVYGFRAFFLMDNRFITKLKAGIFTFFTKKKKQHIFTTFHAVPLKKLGRDQVGNHVADMRCFKTTFILGDSFSKMHLEHVTFNKIDTILLGNARDDSMFMEKTTELKYKLGLPIDKKIVLFAPTFRNDGIDVKGKNVLRSGINQLQEMDIDILLNALKEKFGGEWVIALRFHYHVSNMVNWDELNEKYPNKIINGNLFSDMADYLGCIDCLITDSSSSMIDFSFRRMPSFIFFPDYVNYKENERGFYLNMEKLPFPFSVDFGGLLQNIQKFSLNPYEHQLQKFYQELGMINDANSSNRIAKYINNYMEKTNERTSKASS